jgi:hypothetical protein
MLPNVENIISSTGAMLAENLWKIWMSVVIRSSEKSSLDLG